MSVDDLLKPHFGQRKVASTLLTQDGCYYPVISHDTYKDRCELKSAPVQRGWGARPMHASTLVMGGAPCKDGFTTTTKQYFGGSKKLNPVRRPPQCPSMLVSQFHIGSPNAAQPKNTDYSDEFVPHDITHAGSLYTTAREHRADQTSGSDVKAAIKPMKDAPSYWSQYNRIHSKLGYLLGPGIPKEYPIRQKYDFISGTTGDPAWKFDNRKTSGNRILHSARVDVQNTSIIS